MARSSKAVKPEEGISDPGTWEQIDTSVGGLREIEALSGYRFPLHHDSIEALTARGFTNGEIYSIVAPRRTLARRKEQNENLSVAESDRVVRLNRISDMADRVFGNHEKAQRWLRKKSRVLNEAPIVLLQSETGAHLVEEELNRIDYGMFA
jgi:putative toxin-antitoxin system antitoxin component (TIGR02293 family)